MSEKDLEIKAAKGGEVKRAERALEAKVRADEKPDAEALQVEIEALRSQLRQFEGDQSREGKKKKREALVGLAASASLAFKFKNLELFKLTLRADTKGQQKFIIEAGEDLYPPFLRGMMRKVEERRDQMRKNAEDHYEQVKGQETLKELTDSPAYRMVEEIVKVTLETPADQVSQTGAAVLVLTSEVQSLAGDGADVIKRNIRKLKELERIGKLPKRFVKNLNKFIIRIGGRFASIDQIVHFRLPGRMSKDNPAKGTDEKAAETILEERQ